MTSCKQVEVIGSEDPTPHKWCVPLKEDVFAIFLARGGPTSVVMKTFGDGSLFSPLLFGKFFDPSDAFPLWEFEPEALLPDQHRTSVDWFQTDTCYVLKAELPSLEENTLQICVENGKVVEISGQWRQQRESSCRKKDWRSSHWWEHGFVRRLELPENAGWEKIEAYVMNNDTLLEIRMPKNQPLAQGNEGAL